jgi:hypothetical protein
LDDTLRPICPSTAGFALVGPVIALPVLGHAGDICNGSGGSLTHHHRDGHPDPAQEVREVRTLGPWTAPPRGLDGGAPIASARMEPPLASPWGTAESRRR